jgi:hypothetical protein
MGARNWTQSDGGASPVAFTSTRIHQLYQFINSILFGFEMNNG